MHVAPAFVNICARSDTCLAPWVEVDAGYVPIWKCSNGPISTIPGRTWVVGRYTTPDITVLLGYVAVYSSSIPMPFWARTMAVSEVTASFMEADVPGNALLQTSI